MCVQNLPIKEIMIFDRRVCDLWMKSGERERVWISVIKVETEAREGERESAHSTEYFDYSLNSWAWARSSIHFAISTKNSTNLKFPWQFQNPKQCLFWWKRILIRMSKLIIIIFILLPPPLMLEFYFCWFHWFHYNTTHFFCFELY